MRTRPAFPMIPMILAAILSLVVGAGGAGAVYAGESGDAGATVESVCDCATMACLTYGPAYTLTGRLTAAFAWGLPSYGQHPEGDEPEPYIVLTTLAPTCIVGTHEPEAAEGHDSGPVRRFQIILDSAAKWGSAKAALRAGQPVTATGGLFPQVSGHHHERELLYVDTLTQP